MCLVLDMDTEESEQRSERQERGAAGRPDKTTDKTSDQGDKSDQENKEPTDQKEGVKKSEKVYSSGKASPMINGGLSDSDKEHDTDVSFYYYVTIKNTLCT